MKSKKELCLRTFTPHFELIKEIEMTNKEYKRFLKMDNHDIDFELDLCGQCGDECHVATEISNVIIEPLNK